MEKAAEYIKRFEITSLWNGQKHIVWDLKPDVNILSGINGAGKSTILNRLAQRLSTSYTLKNTIMVPAYLNEYGSSEEELNLWVNLPTR